MTFEKYQAKVRRQLVKAEMDPRSADHVVQASSLYDMYARGVPAPEAAREIMRLLDAAHHAVKHGARNPAAVTLGQGLLAAGLGALGLATLVAGVRLGRQDYS